MITKTLLDRIQRIILRVQKESGHTNGLYVSNEILKEINKLK